MVAVGTIKLCRALTASGMPMECPPPSTSVALGLEMLAISSASARPVSTSPPTVFSSTSSPSMRGSSCNRHQLGDDVLVLGGLLPLRRFGVPFDLADDGQAVDDMTAPGQGDRAQILDIFFFHPVLFCGGVFCRIHARSSFRSRVFVGSVSPGIRGSIQEKRNKKLCEFFAFL